MQYLSLIKVHFQLATLKKGGSSVTDYFQKFKSLADTLAAAGQPLNDFELISFLLAGLGSEFDPFVTSVTTRVDPMSLEELYAHLLTHEMRLEHNSTTAENVFPSANVATARPSSPKNKGSNRAHSQSNGSTRGAPSHKGHNYPNRAQQSRGCFGRPRGSHSSPSSSNHSPRNICQVCNKPGHTALQCYHRFDHSFQYENAPNMQAFNTSACPPTSDYDWYPDTGATNHVTADIANLNMQADNYTGSDQLHVGNGQGLPISHTGTTKLTYHNISFILKNLLHVPRIKKNLLSVSQFTRDNNVYFEFHPFFFCIKDRLTGTTLLRGRTKDGLYTFPTSPPPPRLAFLGERAPLDRWHCRLGHPSLRIISQVVQAHNLALFKNKNMAICPACRMGKSHALPFHLSPSLSKFPLELIFTDVWGPSPFPSNNGNRYYVSFIDDFSKFVWLFPIATKSAVTSIFIQFQKHVENLFDRKIKAVQSDWGGEFRALNPILSRQGISHRLSCPHTHQ
jgi:hypothetical protein